MRLDKLRRLGDRLSALEGVRDAIKADRDLVMGVQRDNTIERARYTRNYQAVPAELEEEDAKLKARRAEIDERYAQVGEVFGMLKELYDAALKYAVAKGAVKHDDYDLVGNGRGSMVSFGQNGLRGTL